MKKLLFILPVLVMLFSCDKNDSLLEDPNPESKLRAGQSLPEYVVTLGMRSDIIWAPGDADPYYYVEISGNNPILPDDIIISEIICLNQTKTARIAGTLGAGSSFDYHYANSSLINTFKKGANINNVSISGIPGWEFMMDQLYVYADSFWATIKDGATGEEYECGSIMGYTGNMSVTTTNAKYTFVVDNNKFYYGRTPYFVKINPEDHVTTYGRYGWAIELSSNMESYLPGNIYVDYIIVNSSSTGRGIQIGSPYGQALYNSNPSAYPWYYSIPMWFDKIDQLTSQNNYKSSYGEGYVPEDIGSRGSFNFEEAHVTIYDSRNQPHRYILNGSNPYIEISIDASMYSLRLNTRRISFRF